MAEIRLKKRKKPLWPWAVGLIILLTLSWGVFESLRYRDRNNHNVGLDHDADRSEVPEGFAFDSEDEEGRNQSRDEKSMEEFIRFSQGEAVYDIGDNYEAEGLQKLALALEALATEGSIESDELDRKLHSLRSRSEHMASRGEEHGDSARVAMTEAVDAFRIIQRELDPDEDEIMKTLDESIKGYNPSESEARHKEDMEDFFNKSAMAIEVLRNKDTRN